MAQKKLVDLPPGFRTNELLQAHAAVAEAFPQLYAVLASNAGDFLGLNVKLRDDGVFMVLKRYGTDGRPEVIFSSGYDAISAMLSMEKSLAGGRWREDKPWKP